MPSSTTPSLQRLSIHNTKAVISALKEDGGLILTDFTTPEAVAQVNAETEPYLRSDKPWKGALFPPETRRCPRLIARSRTAREQWLVNPELKEILNYFLSKTTQNYYDDTLHTYTTEPLLDVATTLEVNPGAKAQRLHRDDKVHHADHFDQTVSGHQMGTDVSMSILIPGIATTRENGATYVRRADSPLTVTFLEMLTLERYFLDLISGAWIAPRAKLIALSRRWCLEKPSSSLVASTMPAAPTILLIRPVLSTPCSSAEVSTVLRRRIIWLTRAKRLCRGLRRCRRCLDSIIRLQI